MFNWLKKHFIPHKGNKNRPHFFHWESVVFVIFIILCIELLSFIPLSSILKSGNDNAGAVLLSVLGGLTNNERALNNVPELKVNPLLEKAATLKAEDMAKNGYFAHVSPDGKTPWYWLDKVGYKYDYAGENLAINFTDTKDVTDAWMNSPTHRANIVKASYAEMGSGMAVGMYQGKETIFVVQDYANPRNINVIADTRTPKVSSSISTKSIPTPGLKSTTTLHGKILGVVSAAASLELPKASVPNVLQIAVFSPRHLTDGILGIILTFIIVVLVLKMAINFRMQHWDLVRNGLLIVLVIISLYFINSYRSSQNTPTTTTFDYSMMN